MQGVGEFLVSEKNACEEESILPDSTTNTTSSLIDDGKGYEDLLKTFSNTHPSLQTINPSSESLVQNGSVGGTSAGRKLLGIKYKSLNPNKIKLQLRTSGVKSSTFSGKKVCVYCDKVFASSRSLANHRHIHSRKRRFTCKVCYKTFLRRYSLSRQNGGDTVLSDINDKEHGILEEEGYNVPTATSLTSCDALVPVSTIQVPDSTSSTTFSLLSGKIGHETLETNQKLHLSPRTSGYGVSSSNRDDNEDGVGGSGEPLGSLNQPAYTKIIKLKSRSSLNRLYKQPYIVCNKGSADSSALAKYKLIPIDERKFVCHVCHRAFIQHNHLIKHMFSHQYKKPFACDAEGCKESYRNITLLRQHKENYHNIKRIIQAPDAVPPNPDDISATSTMISETCGLEVQSSVSQLQLITSHQDNSKQIEVPSDTGNKCDNRQNQAQCNPQTINPAAFVIAQDYGQNTLSSQNINSEQTLEKRETSENVPAVIKTSGQTASLQLPDHQNQSQEGNFSQQHQQQQPGILNSQETRQLSPVVSKSQASQRNTSPTVLTSHSVNTGVETTPIPSGGSLYPFLREQTVISSVISNLLSNNSATNSLQNIPATLQVPHRKKHYPLLEEMLSSSQILDLNYTNLMKELNLTQKSFHPQSHGHHPVDQMAYLFTQEKPYNHPNHTTTDSGNILNRIQCTPLPVSQNHQDIMIPNSSRQLFGSEIESAASQLQFLAFLCSSSQKVGVSSDSDRQNQGQCNPQTINTAACLTDERLMANTLHSEDTTNSEQALILQETTENNSNIIKTVHDPTFIQLSKYQNQHKEVSSSEHQQQSGILNSQEVRQLFPDVSSFQVSGRNTSPTIFSHMIKTEGDGKTLTTMEIDPLSFLQQQDQTAVHSERASSLTTCNETSFVPNTLTAPGGPLLENNTSTPEEQLNFPNYVYLAHSGLSEGLQFTQEAFHPPSYHNDHSSNQKPKSMPKLKPKKKKISIEASPFECTLCHKKFKNRFGLNGHMKIHGGYIAQRCCYCLKPRPNVQCSYIRCKKVFHYPCCLQNDTLGEFIGKFDCYCIDHRPRQEVREVDERGSEVSDLMCTICLYPVENNVSNETLKAPCCTYTWFHRTCVQRLALSAGCFFKCPVCNNKDLFNMEMCKHGIHIQEQNASLEHEENTFEELRIRYCQCDAAYCICPKGRNFNSKGSEWEILVCRTCGSQGSHLICRDPKYSKSCWECPGCVAVTEKLKNRTSETKSNNINDNEEVEATGESSSSEFAHSILLEQNKKKAENLEEDSAELKKSRKERDDVTSPTTDLGIKKEKMLECEVKLVRLEDLFHHHQRNLPAMYFQDDSFKKKTNVSEGKISESLHASRQVIDNDKLSPPEVVQKGSTNLSLDKGANIEHWSNPWKDFNDVNLTSNKPVFFQINHGVNPDMYRLDILMRQGDGKPPVKLGFRNLLVPSVHANDTNQQTSIVTLEQLLSDLLTRTDDTNQSDCSSSSREVRGFKPNTEKKLVHEPTSKSSSSNSKNYLKESHSSTNVEHYHSAIHHLAYNQGSKLEKQAHDHDIPPTSENKVHPETKHMSHKSFLSKDSRKKKLLVSKVHDITDSLSSDVQLSDKPVDSNSRLEYTTQSKHVSSVKDKSRDNSDAECLSQDTVVDDNSVCGVTSENEDHYCMATPQSIRANSALTESVTTCMTSDVLKTAEYDTSKKNLTVFEISNSIGSFHNKDQSVIKPKEIGFFNSAVEAQKITEVDKVDLQNTDKSVSQMHHLIFEPYKYTSGIHGQDQPVMGSQEVAIFHSEDETQQATEANNMEQQITEELTSNYLVHSENSPVGTTENIDLPQDIVLAHDSNKALQVTEVDTMELQKTFKPTNQNYCMVFVKNNNNGTFQDDDLPIIVPQDLSLIHPTHEEDRMELQNTNRSTSKNDCVFVRGGNYKCTSQDEVQPIIVPQNLNLSDYSPQTEVSRMEFEKANKSARQNDYMVVAENNNKCTFQDEDLSVIVPQDISLIHPALKTPQITEADDMELKKANKSGSQNDYMMVAESANNCTFQNEDLPVIIVPQDINLISSALETQQITEADKMELQITNVYSLTDSLEETSESGQMVEDILYTRQSEESRAPNPRDLRTPSPVLFEIYSSDESDCVILSDSETQNKDK
ncbi:uncharacterized protein LOC106465260 isoform X2 [Limulus polyphemus]|uniref:Uncharacterized protein LOC106465260 isoform X2 n=1 Tax=Limulus polyphemus TaxID=6850 RepID=A0ABM1SYX8_LIMPO|nr:uncharacterized protein LOC106465260 isoform X2 [Limulus polyphemus]